MRLKAQCSHTRGRCAPQIVNTPRLKLVPKELLHPDINPSLDLGEARERCSARRREYKILFCGLLHEPGCGFVAKRIEQADGFRMQVDGVSLAVLAALFGDRPLAGIEVNLAPAHPCHLFAPLACEKQKLDHVLKWPR